MKNNTHSAEWKKRNPEKVKAYSKKYYAEHRDERIKYAREYQLFHGDEIKEKRRKRNIKNAEEISAKDKAYRLTHKKELRAYNMMRYHGITLEELDKLRIIQDNKCAICKRDLIPGKSTHLDHDHKTNKNRGLLCTSCNLGIGGLGDSSEIVLSAYKYLKYWEN